MGREQVCVLTPSQEFVKYLQPWTRVNRQKTIYAENIKIKFTFLCPLIFNSLSLVVFCSNLHSLKGSDFSVLHQTQPYDLTKIVIETCRLFIPYLYGKKIQKSVRDRQPWFSKSHLICLIILSIGYVIPIHFQNYFPLRYGIESDRNSISFYGDCREVRRIWILGSFYQVMFETITYQSKLYNSKYATKRSPPKTPLMLIYLPRLYRPKVTYKEEPSPFRKN